VVEPPARRALDVARGSACGAEDRVDFDSIAESPKPFVGYADITALHVALRQRAGLATFSRRGVRAFFPSERHSSGR
jgi:hypothetical protein